MPQRKDATLIRDDKSETDVNAKPWNTRRAEVVEAVAGGLAHDINNALAAILGHADLVRAVIAEGHQAVESLEMIEAAVKKAAAATESLLALTGRSKNTDVPVNLARVVEDSSRLIRCFLPTSVAVESDCSSDGHVWVKCAAPRLQHLFMILAIDARDGLSRGGVFRMSLHGGRDSALRQDRTDSYGDDEWAVVTVEVGANGAGNTGPGADSYPTVVDRCRSGIDAGLPLIREIAGEHGGEVHLDPCAEGRTRVVIRLPCCRASNESRDGFLENPIRRGEGETLVLLEANQQIRSIMASALRMHGYDVVLALDCKDAMASLALTQSAGCLLVMDLDSVGDSACEVLGEIGRSRPGLPIVAIASGVDRIEGRLPDGVRLLQKPFAVPVLLEAIAETLQAFAVGDGIVA